MLAVLYETLMLSTSDIIGCAGAHAQAHTLTQLSYCLEWKFDGVALALRFDQASGMLAQALTRWV
jgi:NAD-dependent DNA ligase